MEWNFLEQSQESGLEFGTIFLALELIAGEMNRQATSGSLPIQSRKAQQIVGPDQNMDNIGHIGHTFDPLQLVEQRTAVGSVANGHQMLRLIEDHRSYAMPLHRLLHRVAQF